MTPAPAATKRPNRYTPRKREQQPSTARVIANELRESAQTIAWMVEDFGSAMTREQAVQVEAAVKRAIGSINAIAMAVANG